MPRALSAIRFAMALGVVSVVGLFAAFLALTDIGVICIYE